MNVARHHLAAISLAVLAAAVLTIAQPLAESDDSTRTITIDQIRLGQPVLPGLPVILWQGDSLMVSVPGDAGAVDASELSDRLVRLHEDEVFESHWRELVGAVAAAATPLGSDPAMLRHFNLETLPNMLLARPELVQALMTGNAPEKALPYGRTECIKRTWGNLEQVCSLWIGWVCTRHENKCNTSVNAATCFEDEPIVCPSAVSDLSLQYD